MDQAMSKEGKARMKERLNALHALWKAQNTSTTGTETVASHPVNLEDYGIYARYADATFANLEKRGIPTQIKSQYQKIKEYAEHLDENVKQGKGLILSGPVGNMKTTLAMAILRQYIDMHQRGFAISMPSFLTMIDYNYKFNLRDNRIDRIKRAKLLVLDALGAEYDHQWVQTQVDAIITERYNRKLATIITTNLSRDEIADRYQARIYDRLKCVNYLIGFEAKSLRQPLNWANH